MKVVIVGGGPAGMLSAIAASRNINRNDEVILIEKNEKLGKKLFITGKGRCNVTNNCEKEEFFKNIVRNDKFMFSAFNKFSNNDFMKLLSDNGCKLKIERGNRVFPVSDKSYDITDCLKRILKKQNVKILLNHKLIDIKTIEKKNNDLAIEKKSNEKENNDFHKKIATVKIKNLINSKNIDLEIDKLIIATGGLTYPSTGSTGDGYKFAEKLGIDVKKQSPSLVPLEIDEVKDCILLDGLLLKNVGITVYSKNDKKIVYNDFGELLFTSFGVSGPTILSASCFLDFDENEKYILSIDFKKALTSRQLDERLLREFEKNRNNDLKKVLKNLLPNKMVDVFINRLNNIYNNDIKKSTSISNNYDVNEIKIAEVDKELRNNINSLLKDFRLTIISKRNYDEAIITKGGIDVKELNPKTMESKKIKGLYFAGEVIDIDCMTGGFNIQVAASTGYVAGLNSFLDKY